MGLMDVNIITIVSAAVVQFILGAIWHGPLFGKQWIKLSGITTKQMKEMQKHGMSSSYITTFIGSLLTAFVLSRIVQMLSLAPITGAQMGAFIWLGFLAPVMMGPVLWEGKPLQLYAINSGYYLVSLTVMGAIVAL